MHLRDGQGKDHLVLADMGCRNTIFNAQAQSGAVLGGGWGARGAGAGCWRWVVGAGAGAVDHWLCPLRQLCCSLLARGVALDLREQQVGS